MGNADLNLPLVECLSQRDLGVLNMCFCQRIYGILPRLNLHITFADICASWCILKIDRFIILHV